ncbi:MAG: acyl-[acyl-carrier-protein]--UDP-N-acetylglucosamine O-acyltransferase [Bacteroidetes bacterium]|nr:MAG: acyl-[acyl-carrier-protein]--UDP-N-acetylglucosamine O-acyltransferase [Bacteroidota bacterium]
MKQPLAYIHPEAKIASNVTISPFVTIEKDVEIGEGTWIGPNVTIFEGAQIGKNCKIFPGAVISAIPQDLKFDGEITTVKIGDNTTIRECVTVNRGTNAAKQTTIGNNCLLMAYAHVAHDCVVGNNCILVNGVQAAGEVKIDDWAIIGGTSAIHQFVHIGSHVMISGGSLVRKDVPPYVKAAHEPLSYIGINSVGLRRRKFTPEQVKDIQEIYRIIYQKGYNHAQALEIIESEIPSSEERDEIIQFVKNSKRGIMKGYESK